MPQKWAMNRSKDHPGNPGIISNCLLRLVKMNRLDGRLLFPVFVMVAVMMVIPMSVEADDSVSNYGMFEVDYMMFETIDDHSVSLINVDYGCPVDLKIPSEVTWEGKSYTVTSIVSFSIILPHVETLFIPASIESIEYGAIECQALREIIVDEGNYDFFTMDGILCSMDPISILCYPPAKTDTSFVVPPYFTDVGGSAFQGAENLRSVILPDKLDVLRANTFYGCINLESVGSSYGPTILPLDLIYIDSMAFGGCESLKEVILPPSLIGMGSLVFSNCVSLVSIEIPESVSFIGNSAFKDCTSLSEFIVSQNNLQFVSKDGVLFMTNSGVSATHSPLVLVMYPPAKTDEVYLIGDNVLSIQSGAFSGAQNLKEVLLPSNMTYVPSGAFSGCESLVKVTIPPSVLAVEFMAFYGCTNLSEVYGMDSVVSIGEMAFDGCAFTELVLPEFIETIGVWSLAGCINLKEIRIPASVKEIEVLAFYGCTSLERIIFDSADVNLKFGSLSVGSQENTVYLDVIAPKGFSLAEDTHDEYTVINLIIMGEKPFPLENLIGIAICLAVLFIIIRLFKEV